MTGMDAQTGRALSGTAHLVQSIGKILTTPVASRTQRRTFGSDIPELIDAPLNETTGIRLYAAAATALMRWEPRLELTRMQLVTDPNRHVPTCLDIEGHVRKTDSYGDISGDSSDALFAVRVDLHKDRRP